jgi:hypothetical protein
MSARRGARCCCVHARARRARTNFYIFMLHRACARGVRARTVQILFFSRTVYKVLGYKILQWLGGRNRPSLTTF